MLSQTSDLYTPEEVPVIKFPEMTTEVSITKNWVFLPIRVWKVRTHNWLSTKIQALVKEGLWEDFSWKIRIRAIRGVVPNKVDRLLMFALPNNVGWHDVLIEVPKTNL